MNNLFQLQQKVSELLTQYAKDSEWTLECLHKEQELKQVLKKLKSEKLRYPEYI
jgi:hypothetical protein